MAPAVYLLCAVTSLACAILLWRGYARSSVKLLFWSALCFAGLALNNVLLIVDLVVFPDAVDLSVWRKLPAVAGVSLLIYGLVTDS
jgi:hypothetical protein